MVIEIKIKKQQQWKIVIETGERVIEKPKNKKKKLNTLKTARIWKFSCIKLQNNLENKI